MPTTKPLTRTERAWLAEFQAVLDRCPSTRIGFYSIGDANLGLYDATREQEIGEELDVNGGEWGSAAARLKADFDQLTLRFPTAVQSTAG